MPADCLFCRINAREIPAAIVHDGPDVLAFSDIDPKAPVHVLVIPKLHVADIGALGAHPQAAAALIAGISQVVADLGLISYRTIFNTGPDAGQTVFHVHAHILAGRAQAWPPG